MRKRTSTACARVNRLRKPRPERLLLQPPISKRRHTLQSLLKFPVFLNVVILFAAILMPVAAGMRCLAQPSAKPDSATQLTELLKGVPDVTIFVIPTSGDTARVSFAFSSRVPHAQVRKEITKLGAKGWGLGAGVSVEDSAIAGAARVTTSGHFTLFKAPQVVNSAPAVLPYLQAFQDRGHVTVVFLMSELSPYNGVDDFQTPALIVRRMPAANIYQYEALIQDHTGSLPQLTAANSTHSAPAKRTGPIPGAVSAGVPLLPLMLGLCAIGLIGGMCVYNWLARRADRSVPTRRAR